MSLAHRGVLFLDELPEFPRPALEALRQPLESGRTTVARALAHVTYPARFQLVAAMNPCRCGYLGDAARACSRAPRCGEDYLARISGPLLDRIDITIHVQPIPPTELSRAPLGEPSAAVAIHVQPIPPTELSRAPLGEPSAAVAARVAFARTAQRTRYGAEGPATNAEAELGAIDLQPEARSLAETVAAQLRLSARGFTRVLRVARTIADLARAPQVRRADVAEALAYRARIPGRPG